ncbi:MAG: hypothetical protein ABH835_01155 [Patescibacteria group bacterium]
MTKTKKSSHFDLPSVTSLWHNTWEIFSHHFIKILALTAIPILLFDAFYLLGATSTMFSLESLRTPLELFSFSNGYVYFITILAIAMIFIYVVGVIALFLMVGNADEYGIWQALKKSIEFFWGFVLMSILIGFLQFLFLILSYLLVTTISVLIGLVGSTYLNLFFDYVLVIPFIVGFLVSIYLIFSPYLLIIKRKSAFDSIKISFNLVKGHFWAIIIRLLTAYVTAGLFIIILGLIPTVGTTLAGLITLPFLVIFTYSLFKQVFDLKQIPNQ